MQTLRGLLRGDGYGPAADIYSGRAAMSLSALQDKLLELDPLHMACAKGQREIVRFLLTEVAPWSVMVHDKQGGSTALHTCARFGHADIARDLLRSGALVCARDRGDCTARERTTYVFTHVHDDANDFFFGHPRKGNRQQYQYLKFERRWTALFSFPVQISEIQGHVRTRSGTWYGSLPCDDGCRYASFKTPPLHWYVQQCVLVRFFFVDQTTNDIVGPPCTATKKRRVLLVLLIITVFNIVKRVVRRRRHSLVVQQYE